MQAMGSLTPLEWLMDSWLAERATSLRSTATAGMRYGPMNHKARNGSWAHRHYRWLYARRATGP